jgi:hypothetical protein
MSNHPKPDGLDIIFGLGAALKHGVAELREFIGTNGPHRPIVEGSGILVYILRHESNDVRRAILLKTAISHGCLPDGLPHANITPLFEAINRRDAKCARLLLNSGALVDHATVFSPIRPLGAVLNGLTARVELSQLLLGAGADPNAAPDGNHPLDQAFSALDQHRTLEPGLHRVFREFARHGMQWRSQWNSQEALQLSPWCHLRCEVDELRTQTQFSHLTSHTPLATQSNAFATGRL